MKDIKLSEKAQLIVVILRQISNEVLAGANVCLQMQNHIDENNNAFKWFFSYGLIDIQGHPNLDSLADFVLDEIKGRVQSGTFN